MYILKIYYKNDKNIKILDGIISQIVTYIFWKCHKATGIWLVYKRGKMSNRNILIIRLIKKKYILRYIICWQK